MILKIGDSVPLKRQFFCSWKRVGDSSNLSLRVRVNESTIELESKKGENCAPISLKPVATFVVVG